MHNEFHTSIGIQDCLKKTNEFYTEEKALEFKSYCLKQNEYNLKFFFSHK